jgi:HSP20 family protein
MIAAISIARIHDPDEALSAVSALTEEHLADVRHRAFDYFQERGRSVGNDWDDWLRAERKLLWSPRAEMFESSFTIVLRVGVPGFGPKSIQVTATPRSILIQGTESHQHDGLDTRLHFCEFGERLFRRFDLPSAIDPATVAATLDKGVLEIVAGILRRPRGAQHLQAST